MPEPKEWVTVKEAAFLADRDVRQIYRWIDNGLLARRTNTSGVTIVLRKAVQRIETEVKRGRPKGSVSRR